jgi:ribonucleotide monophosphatase NagD (HAD superfamily)
VSEAGGRIVESSDESACVVAICDDAGYDMRRTIDNVITTLFRRFDRDEATYLCVPNPDLLYLRGEHAYGITAGSVALIVEAALKLRFPGAGHRFERLGKPHAPMFERAMTRIGGIQREQVVMLGDQLVTDIQGANDFGIDSVLVTTGISRVGSQAHVAAAPTYTLAGLT